MEAIERRFLPQAAAGVNVSQRADGSPIIEGYGAVFYDGTEATQYRIFDDLVERIMPTAFDKALLEDDVRGLLNHNPDNLLGRTKSGTMKLAKDAKGLKYEISPPDTGPGRDTQTSIKRGDLSGSSFSFIGRNSVWREEGELVIREIHDCGLFDTGPVTFPAYTGTTTSARSIGPPEKFAEYEAIKAKRSGKLTQQERDRIAARARVVGLQEVG